MTGESEMRREDGGNDSVYWFQTDFRMLLNNLLTYVWLIHALCFQSNLSCFQLNDSYILQITLFIDHTVSVVHFNKCIYFVSK